MYIFKMYFTGDQEQFEHDPWGGQGASATQKTLPYLESLLSFLELDCTDVERTLQEILDSWNTFFSAGDNAQADSALQQMGALTSKHIYFRLPYLQWFARRAQGTLEPEMTKELFQLSEQLTMYQRQAQIFLEHVLDIDQVGRETQQNTRRQYRFDQPRDPELFRFEAIPVSFGPVDGDACGPILQPNTVRDLIDFSLRECVMRGIPVRRCKSCGRYFPLTGGSLRSIANGPTHLERPAAIPARPKNGRTAARTTLSLRSTAESINAASPGSRRVKSLQMNLPSGAKRHNQKRKNVMMRKFLWMSSRLG